jgi:hypothetical protein
MVLYGRGSSTLREEHRLRVFENKVLKRILDGRGVKWREVGEICITRTFMIFTLR